jgi:hypothetical protein
VMQVLTQLQDNAQQEKKNQKKIIVLELWLIFFYFYNIFSRKNKWFSGLNFFSTKGYKVWSFSPQKKKKIMDEINEKNSLYAISSS